MVFIYLIFLLIFSSTETTGHNLGTCSSPAFVIGSVLRGEVPLKSLRPSISPFDPSCPKPDIHSTVDSTSNQCSTDNSTIRDTILSNDGNLSNDSDQKPPSGDVQNASEPPIATFEEWTKEKLSKQDRRKPPSEPEKIVTDPMNTTPESQVEVKEEPRVVQEQSFTVPITTAKRNYASKECGAKVVFANPEAENRGAILNDKEKDEYMRNPCEKAQNKFLVVELCETIQPTIIEIANFELFSSNPKEFKVSISERYPAVEWIDVGEFTAQDTRDVQTFSITPKGSYAKFVKIELLSHYGKEHYCTLSLFRAYGISMVDEYEAEADAIIDGKPIHEATTMVQEPVGTVQESIQATDKNETEKEASNGDKELKQDIEENRDENISSNLVGKVVHVVGNVFGTALGKFLPFKLEGSNKTYVWRLSDCWMCPKRRVNSRRSFPFCLAFDLKNYRSSYVTKPAKKPVNPSRPVRTLEKLTKGQEKVLHFVQKWLIDMTLKNQCLNSSRPQEAKPKEHQNVDPVVEHVVKVAGEPVTPSKPQPVSKGTSADPEANLSTAAKNGNGNGSGNKVENLANGNGMPRHDPLPGMKYGHKESIFMKLNKRLTALELNISLSSEYLSELSRRYVAQTEENRKQNERLQKAVEEMNAESTKQLKDEFEEQITDLQKQIVEISDIVKSFATIYSTTPYPYSLSVTELPPRDNCNIEQEIHLLPSEDHLWTGEQVKYAVLGAMLSTVIALALFAYCFQKLRSSTPELTAESIKELIRQELDSRSKVQEVATNENNESNPANKDVKRKKKRKKLSILSGLSEPWDSAMETSSSLPPTHTPTPSELSSEIENPHFNPENAFAQTPLASDQPRMIRFDRLPDPLRVDTLPSSSIPEIPEESAVVPQSSSPPWKLVIPNKFKKKSSSTTTSTQSVENKPKRNGYFRN